MDQAEGRLLNGSIAKIAAGDSRGIDEIYQAIGGRLLSVAFGVVKNRAAAEDVLQDSLVRVVRFAGQFRPGSNGYAWICKIVKNTALNRLKSERLRTGMDIDAFWSLSDDFREVERTEETLLVEQALSALDETERRVIHCKYFMDMTVREIAAETGISKSGVQRIVERAERKMRERL